MVLPIVEETLQGFNCTIFACELLIIIVFSSMNLNLCFLLQTDKQAQGKRLVAAHSCNHYLSFNCLLYYAAHDGGGYPQPRPCRHCSSSCQGMSASQLQARQCGRDSVYLLSTDRRSLIYVKIRRFWSSWKAAAPSSRSVCPSWSCTTKSCKTCCRKILTSAAS